MSPKLKKVLLHGGIVLLFFFVSVVYMWPILEGKTMLQDDVIQYRWSSSEYAKYKAETGDDAYWNSSAFSGMPMYQMHNIPSKNIFQPLKYVLTLTFIGDGPEGRNCDWGILFLYLLGFYLAMLALGANPWLSLLGAFAFGFGSYNIIIISVGHVTKAWAISAIAPILAGIILVFRKKYLWGLLLFTFSLGLQIQFNHIQITYYTLIMSVVVVLTYLVYSIVGKDFKSFVKGAAGLLVCVVLVLLSTSRYFMVNAEYVEHTMRGGSKLAEADSLGNTEGLDEEYASAWSYGKSETMTLLVPGFSGGSSDEPVSHDSEFYKLEKKEVAPMYWGDQQFTAGPIYLGAIVVFLFVFGLLAVKGPERWWLASTAIIGVLLAWGGNCQWLNGFLRDYLPMYNKFRSLSMSLVMVGVSSVVMSVLVLKQIVNDTDRRKYNPQLYVSAGITLLACLLVAFVGSTVCQFSGVGDASLAEQYGRQWPAVRDALVLDRESLMFSDALRSFAFVIAAAILLWLYMNDKLKNSKLIVLLIGVIILIDLVGVDSRYLNENKYAKESSLDFKPDDGDRKVYELARQNNDRDYRVFNIKPKQGAAFFDARTSAFHHSVGGYSGAKLSRYQDVIEKYLASYNKNVMNMLNIRYFLKYKDGQYQVRRNADAYGNAWFVDSVMVVSSANEEFCALENTDLQTSAIVNCSEFENVGLLFKHDSLATISLLEDKVYNPNIRKYATKSSHDAFAVFSEIYYKPDWKAYIDGKPCDYLRANYLLRAMNIPAGEHTVEFRNEAPTFHRWEKVEIVSSVILFLLVVAALILHFRAKSNSFSAN